MEVLAGGLVLSLVLLGTGTGTGTGTGAGTTGGQGSTGSTGGAETSTSSSSTTSTTSTSGGGDDGLSCGGGCTWNPDPVTIDWPTKGAAVLSPVTVSVSVSDTCYCDTCGCYSQEAWAVSLRVDGELVASCNIDDCPPGLDWSISLDEGKHTVEAVVEYGTSREWDELSFYVTGQDPDADPPGSHAGDGDACACRGDGGQPGESSWALVLLLSAVRRRRRSGKPVAARF